MATTNTRNTAAQRGHCTPLDAAMPRYAISLLTAFRYFRRRVSMTIPAANVPPGLCV